MLREPTRLVWFSCGAWREAGREHILLSYTVRASEYERQGAVEGAHRPNAQPLNRPVIPRTPKFAIFSKWLRNSKNFIAYEKYSKYPKYNLSFSKLWCCCGQILFERLSGVGVWLVKPFITPRLKTSSYIFQTHVSCNIRILTQCFR